MKAILEFNLPENKEEFDVASKGMDWALLAWDIDQFIRNKINMNKTKMVYYNLFVIDYILIWKKKD